MLIFNFVIQCDIDLNILSVHFYHSISILVARAEELWNYMAEQQLLRYKHKVQMPEFHCHMGYYLTISQYVGCILISS